MDGDSNVKVRRFRSTESYESERVTRDMLKDFLSRRGFGNVTDERKGGAQTIFAIDPYGDRLTIRVRLCWRRGSGARNSTRAKKYSAAQLLAHIKNNDPEETLREKVERERAQGVSHFLIVQREDERIIYAALIPISELLTIWRNERDISAKLIEQHQLGRVTKNHALNGSSPTLYLQDDRAPEVAAALWNHPGVRDLAKITPPISVWLPDEEADEDKSNDSATYNPLEGDRRQMVVRQIRERRGQQQFRDSLRERYGDRCLVTGCEVLAVLEAAHISPYRGEGDNHPENGLLLRADIHTLFDLDLIGIEPDRLQVELHPAIANEYGNLSGTTLGSARERRPSRKALQLRYEQFRQRLGGGDDVLPFDKAAITRL